MWVMENFLLTFVGDCLSRPMPDPAWIEALYEALLAHLRVWLGAYARETRREELPADLETWSLCRLIAAYQRAYEVAPADPAYRLLTPAELAHRSASFA